jgi:hypothetical protein
MIKAPKRERLFARRKAMTGNVQFRVWDGTGWENTPIAGTHRCKDHAIANERAAALSDTANAEVRWNWEGSLQGHYITANLSRLPEQWLHELWSGYAASLDKPREIEHNSGTVEFKVWAGLGWASTPVSATRKCKDATKARKWAEIFSDTANAEIRWNWVGSLQGHYVSVNISRLPELFRELWGYNAPAGTSLDEQAESERDCLLDDLNEALLKGEYRRGKAEAEAAFNATQHHRVTIVVPTADQDGELLNDDRRNRALDTVQRHIAGLYGGFTAYRADGGWVDNEEDLVSETVTVVEAYTEQGTATIKGHLHDLAEELAATLDQTCVLWTLDNKAHFVSQPDTAE